MQRLEPRRLRLPGMATARSSRSLGPASGVASVWGRARAFAAATLDDRPAPASSSRSDDELERAAGALMGMCRTEASQTPAGPASPLLGGGHRRLVWLGHSTVLIELDGVRLLTDPVLRDRIGPICAGSRRRCAPGRSARRLRAPVPPARRPHRPPRCALSRASGPIIAPASARSLAAWPAALNPVHRGSAADEVGVGRRDGAATPAVHDGRRWPLGPAPAALGFLIRGSRSVYFAGDTDLFDAMAELRGSVDVALLPVWGWGRGVGPGHLDPRARGGGRRAHRARGRDPDPLGDVRASQAVVRPATDPAAPALEFSPRSRPPDARGRGPPARSGRGDRAMTAEDAARVASSPSCLRRRRRRRTPPASCMGRKTSLFGTSPSSSARRRGASSCSRHAGRPPAKPSSASVPPASSPGCCWGSRWRAH